jgi:hypothetical protein
MSLDRRRIIELFEELGRRLEARGVRRELYVVGGAAIALAYDERRATHDIDAVFEPKMVVYDEASVRARDLSLDEGWLNDAVKAFLPGPDPQADVVLDRPGVSVATASPRLLLALKVLAHRSGEDEDDVRLLARALGLTSASEVLAVAEDVVGDRLDLAARFFVEELFVTKAGPLDSGASSAADWLTPATATGLTPVERHRGERPTAEVLDEDRAE